MIEYKDKSNLSYENIEESIKAILRERKQLSNRILNTTSSLEIQSIKRQITQLELHLKALLLLGDTEGMDLYEGINFK